MITREAIMQFFRGDDFPSIITEDEDLIEICLHCLHFSEDLTGRFTNMIDDLETERAERAHERRLEIEIEKQGERGWL